MAEKATLDAFTQQPVRRRWLRWLPALAPVYVCEVCGGTGVRRSGDWDFCPVGHRYVGVRTENAAA